MQINKDLRVTDGAYYNLDLDTIAKNGIYSTDEIIVGRWIDGKPLYRRVLSLNTPNNVDGSTQIGSFTALIKQLIKLESVIDLTQYNDWVPVPQYLSAGNSIHCYLEVSNSINKIMMAVNNTAYQNRPVIVILEYTKTTD